MTELPDILQRATAGAYSAGRLCGIREAAEAVLSRVREHADILETDDQHRLTVLDAYELVGVIIALAKVKEQ